MSTFRRKAPYRKMWVGVKVAFRLSERDPGFVSAEVAGGDGSGCLSGEDTALSAYSAGPELRDLDAWGETDGLRGVTEARPRRAMPGAPRLFLWPLPGAAGAEKVITGRMWNDVTRGVKITLPGPRW
ncbi:hypothetical protein Bbelb_424190 [Branchiostoma belcheri]|nr:hypothetical protein Bbelb_424190 [Branchiostoma belcheri]